MQWGSVFLVMVLHTIPCFANVMFSLPVPAQTIAAHHKIFITCSEGFEIAGFSLPSKKKKILSPIVCATVQNGTILINDKDTRARRLIIIPCSETVSVMGVKGFGNLLLTVDDQQIQVKAYEEQSADLFCRTLGALLHDAVYTCAQARDHRVMIAEEAESEQRFKTIVSENKDSNELPVVASEIVVKKDLSADYTIRVLLDECDSGDTCRWVVRAHNGFVCMHGSDQKLSRIYNREDIMIIQSRGRLFINGMRCNKEQVFIVPKKGNLFFNDNEYQGIFCLVKTNEKLLLINSLALEDYVYAVLRTESWPGWPLEVNKALAITSRTYAIALVMRSKKNTLPYHIKNTNIHQTYAGFHNTKVLQRAVQQTKGIFLTHDEKPIVAMFDSCCGGVIPAGVDHIDTSKAPYLARDYACPYCKSCSIYSWCAQYTMRDLVRAISTLEPGLKQIRAIKVTKKDKAGLVKQVQVRGVKKQVMLSGKQLYSLISQVKSYCFDVQHKNNTIVFSGRGFGHHVGLCQWGAREMVRQRKTYREILQFYYPGTQFMRLT